MVLGRRRFSWRDDVRGALSVLGLGVATFVVLALFMGLVLLLAGTSGEVPR